MSAKPQPEPTKRTLTVHVGSPDDSFDDIQERLRTIDQGEDPEPLFRVTFQNEQDLQRLLSAKNVQLLRTIYRESPESIRELARLVDRDIRQVHDNLTELADYGLVEFEHEAGAKRPMVWYDDIEIDVPIAPADA